MTETQTIAAQLAAQGLSFRPINADDRGFLYDVYASSREEELAVTGWDAAQKQAFLTMQFNAQHTYYQEHYPQAAFLVILRAGQGIGRLYLDRRPEDLGIIDIALLPEYRGQGIGTAILAAILSEGQRLAVPVRIHVERFNPALRLYTRLGFRQIADQGVYYLMEKTPDAG